MSDRDLERIADRLREQDQKKIKCPYPDCNWSTSYRPENELSRAVSYRKAEKHREEHCAQLQEVDHR